MTYMIWITDQDEPYDQNQPSDDNSLQLIIFVLFHQVGDHLVVVMIINGHNFSTPNEEIIVTIIIWSKLKIKWNYQQGRQTNLLDRGSNSFKEIQLRNVL